MKTKRFTFKHEVILIFALLIPNYFRAADLFGIAGPVGTSGNNYEFVQINTATGHATTLFSFPLTAGIALTDMTFYSPSGKFLIGSASQNGGGKLLILDPITHGITELPITNLPVGLTSTQGLAYDPSQNKLLITLGPTNTFTQNRIAEISLTGQVLQVSVQLAVPDADDIAFNPFNNTLNIADVNDTTGVQIVNDIFGSPSLTPVANSPLDNNLGYPAFSESGELYLARLSTRNLHIRSGNSYPIVGSFGTSYDVRALAFGNLPFTLAATITSAVEISWQSEPTKRYQVQWTSDLSSNQWQDLGIPITATGATTSICDRNAGIPQRFYKILQLN